jgi:tRNA threonylcarbamoyladenosine biosynthesis protein TsaB
MASPERILAIDASGEACSTALWRHGAVAARRYRQMARGHAEALMPMVLETMAEGDETLRRLDAVAVSVGPGAFTGIRIGLAAARGIGLAAAIPVIGVTTFAAVAEAVPEKSDGDLMVLLDTKRGDIFVQRFSASRSPIDLPANLTPQSFAASLTTAPVLLAGDGVALVRSHLILPANDIRFSAALGPVDAVHVAAVAARAIANGSALPARPLYLRAPDVRLATAPESAAGEPGRSRV